MVSTATTAVFLQQNNFKNLDLSQNLDLSYKTDLDFWSFLEEEKLSCIRIIHDWI